MKRLLTAIPSILIIFGTVNALGAQWQQVTGKKNLNDFISGTTLDWKEDGAGNSRGEYRADGTGTLHAWGTSIDRTWEVKGNDQLCFSTSNVTECWQLEKNSDDPKLYRSREIGTGKMTEIRISSDGAAATIQGDPKTVGDTGGAAAPSAAEIAAKLANPSGGAANLIFKNQFVGYEGDLPNAGKQSNYQLFFQPILPFPLENGDQIVYRGGLKLFSDKPFSGNNGFEEASGISDLANEFVYIKTTDSGFYGGGAFLSLPTGSDSSLTSGQVLLGPEIVVGHVIPNEFVFTGVISHAWDIGGWTNTSVSNTTISPIAVFMLEDAWDIGTFGVMNYDWKYEQWTVPLNIGVGKTVILNGTPWKFQVEVDYYVEKPDAFGPEWMVSINIIPVVENKLANWFK